jgi:hypothetical protein
MSDADTNNSTDTDTDTYTGIILCNNAPTIKASERPFLTSRLLELSTKRTKEEVLKSIERFLPAKTIIPDGIRIQPASKIEDNSVTVSDVSATFGLDAISPNHSAETSTVIGTAKLTPCRGGRPPVLNGAADASFTKAGADLSRDPLLLRYANETRVRTNT